MYEDMYEEAKAMIKSMEDQIYQLEKQVIELELDIRKNKEVMNQMNIQITQQQVGTKDKLAEKDKEIKTL